MDRALATAPIGQILQIIPVPEAAQPELQRLWQAHDAAKRALTAYASSLATVLGLSPGTDWAIDTEKMVITLRLEDAAHAIPNQR